METSANAAFLARSILSRNSILASVRTANACIPKAGFVQLLNSFDSLSPALMYNRESIILFCLMSIAIMVIVLIFYVVKLHYECITACVPYSSAAECKLACE